MIENLQFVSIALEAVIAGIFLVIALRGKTFMLGLALTFSIYVVYDLARQFAWDVSPVALFGGFFVATLAALYSAVKLYRRL
ncbi:MAG: hypothetical protein HOJ90_12235 [Alphaproteobacteria bacterium]|jgi:hypothetical protein|nr:hypothetical protein [Alphaproteobacteria bacterium]